MGGGTGATGLAASRLGTTEGSLSGYHKVYIVMFAALGWVHLAHSLRFGIVFYPNLNSPTA